MSPGAGLLALATPRKPEDVCEDEATMHDSAPGSGLQTAKPCKPEDVENHDEPLEPMEPEPKTPRSSFYTFFSELPKGVPIPPNFRTHSRHVIKFRQSLEDLDEQEVMKVVRHARRWWA